MNKLAGHVWSFDELFDAALGRYDARMKSTALFWTLASIVVWGPYAFFAYWWFRLGVPEGFRGELYGPLSFFYPLSLLWGVIGTVAVISIAIIRAITHLE